MEALTRDEHLQLSTSIFDGRAAEEGPRRPQAERSRAARCVAEAATHRTAIVRTRATTGRTAGARAQEDEEGEEARRKAAAALAAAPAAPSDPAEAALRSARADAIASGRRIFVGHLAQDLHRGELRRALAACGEVAAVDMLTRKPKPSRDAADDADADAAPTTGRFKGAAFVDFVDASAAAAALALGSLAVCGKEAVLRPAKAAPAEGTARPAPAAGAPGPRSSSRGCRSTRRAPKSARPLAAAAR